ncbi:MAG TPA: methyltransferase domain-containing protein [Longimicrobiaceae bacterium]
MLRSALRRARLWLAPEYVTRDGVRLPPPHLRFCGPEFKDDGYFLASARGEAARLVGECGLTPASRVLDVGCGPGRLAIGILDRVGRVAEYRGIDVHRPSIEWCDRHLGRSDPPFRFQLVDVRNARYNPEGADLASTIRLPVADGRFDIAYLYSVFSHMLPPDVRGYLREIHRLLAPGGILFFTAFVEEGVPDVSENPDGYVQSWLGPLHCVRYQRGYLEGMLGDAGFETVRFVYGRETNGQSAVYARRSDERARGAAAPEG